jgi:hypothetical protein
VEAATHQLRWCWSSLQLIRDSQSLLYFITQAIFLYVFP